MTALATIYDMQTPAISGPFRERCKFEATMWACIMAAAQLGWNVNDERMPKPD